MLLVCLNREDETQLASVQFFWISLHLIYFMGFLSIDNNFCFSEVTMIKLSNIIQAPRVIMGRSFILDVSFGRYIKRF